MRTFYKRLSVLIAIALLVITVLGVIALLNFASALTIYRYIDTFPAVRYEEQLKPEVDADGAYFFTTDEDFKVLQLTDLHFTGGVFGIDNDRAAINAVAAMVAEEKPDLVVITGDISFAVPWYGSLNNAYAHNFTIRLFEKLGVYWTVTLGNHDSEAYNFCSRGAVAEKYADDDLKYCLFSVGPLRTFGEGNHYINVRNTEGIITRSLVMMDSNAYTEDDPWGINWIYDSIHADQLKWYESIVEKNNAYNLEKSGEVEQRVQHSLFIHIPISATKTAYDEYVANERADTEDIKFLHGIDGEPDPVVLCPAEEDGVFERLYEIGCTDTVFFGHDHLNNFAMEYKGITLSYGYSIDYSAYDGIDKMGDQRGCTVITYSSDGSLEIVKENYYQDKYFPLFEKEEVELKNK